MVHIFDVALRANVAVVTSRNIPNCMLLNNFMKSLGTPQCCCFFIKCRGNPSSTDTIEFHIVSTADSDGLLGDRMDLCED